MFADNKKKEIIIQTENNRRFKLHWEKKEYRVAENQYGSWHEIGLGGSNADNLIEYLKTHCESVRKGGDNNGKHV